MTRLKLGAFMAGWVGYAAALGAVALVSLFIGFVLGQVRLANLSMLYLIAVLATGGRLWPRPGGLRLRGGVPDVRLVLRPPIHQWTVADPEEWLSLLLFLLTAIVTGQLAAGQRDRAREARVREREAVVLYDVVRLMGNSELDAALEAVADRLRNELHLVAVGVELLSPTGEAVRIAAGDAEEVQLLRAAGGASDTAPAGRPAALDNPTRNSRSLGAHCPADAPHCAEARAAA